MTQSNRSALIVASSEYGDGGLQRLAAPPHDARALAAVLENPGIGGFDVRTLLNHPAHDVSLTVEEFFADRRPDDLLLLYFSCHGVKDDDGELYFAMPNSKLPRLLSTAVPAHYVNRCMSRSRSRRIVLLLDCCYAGAFDRGMTPRAPGQVGLREHFDGRGRAVLTASSAIQSAFEGGQLAVAGGDGPSIFTSALVSGLETGDADLDQDGRVSLDELYDYIYEKVRVATPSQTPEKWLFGVQGELIIARRAHPVTSPAPLSAELHVLLESPYAAARTAAVEELARLLRGGHGGRALAARLALERLSDDDSRSVSAAAAAVLSGPQPKPAAPVTRQPAEAGRDTTGGTSSVTAPDAGPAATGEQRRWAPGRKLRAAFTRTKPSPVDAAPPAARSPEKRRSGPVGLDLGTTDSAICVLQSGHPTVIRNAEDSLTTPSVVAFQKNGEVFVGQDGKRQAVTNEPRTICSVKRHMGTDWTASIDGKEYTPEQISALILQKLRRDAEAHLGEKITDAVITVPAYFGDPLCQATREAAEMAGMNVLRIITEPAAAALAYHLENENEATILVFDLGGEALSISLLTAGHGIVEVKATGGDDHLGGRDWDQRIVDWLVKNFKSDWGANLSLDKMALARLVEAGEKSKIQLSSSAQAKISLPYISRSLDGPLHLDYVLTRDEFQQMTSDLLARCEAPFRQVLQDAGITPGDIDHLVLVGGSARMPAVAELARKLTGRKPEAGADPETAVVTGAALLAGVLTGT